MCLNIRCDRNFRRHSCNQTGPKKGMVWYGIGPDRGLFLPSILAQQPTNGLSRVPGRPSPQPNQKPINLSGAGGEAQSRATAARQAGGTGHPPASPRRRVPPASAARNGRWPCPRSKFFPSLPLGSSSSSPYPKPRPHPHRHRRSPPHRRLLASPLLTGV